MTLEEMGIYDAIIEEGIATESEINLAFNMTDKGWMWTLNQIVYVRRGYRSYQEYVDNRDEEEI